MPLRIPEPKLAISQSTVRNPKFSTAFSFALSFSYPLAYWLALGILIAGTVLRFLYLDADPHYSEWLGFITDEGRWVRHGRSLALYGNLTDGSSLHLFIAPLFQLSNYLIFELVGVKILNSRFLTAFCGSAILIVFWGYMRHAITPQALLLGLTLLAFQADLLVLSRIAVPEMTLMLFQLVIYFMIVSSETSSRRLVMAGVLMASVVAVKLTMLLFAPIFFAVLFAIPRSATVTGERWRDVKLFGLALSLPLLAAGLVWYFFFQRTISVERAAQYFSTAIAFIRVSNPYALISFPFAHNLSSTVNLWALGMWLSVLAVWACPRDGIDFLSRRYLASSAIWFTLYLVVMLALEYFPTRYKVHILLPMAVFISVGISLFQKVGVRKVLDSLALVKGPVGLLWCAFFAFPAAALFSPFLVSAVALAGFESGRLMAKVSSLFFLVVVSACILWWFKHNQRVVRSFLIFPVVGGLAWMLLSVTLSDYSFWPAIGSGMHIVAWLLLLGALTVSLWLGSITASWGSNGGARLVTLCAMFYLTVSVVKIAPGYLDPHYSMRDSSRDLGALLSGPQTIGSLGADALFNDNNLRYISLTAPRFNRPGKKPEFLVVAFEYERVKHVLEQEYYPIKTYDVYVAPGYDGEGAGAGVSPAAGLVTVYKKNDKQ